MITFSRLKALSFAHSAAYCGLLVAWIIPGADAGEQVFGWTHGVGWILMSLLCLYAVRARIIPLWLGAMVIIVGGIGPFAGTAAFVHEDRRRGKAARGMV